MGKSLKEIAEQLKNSDKKVQLLYAFNGIGKTRLSGEFKELFTHTSDNEEELELLDFDQKKVLYYNAFTEDLFYWKKYPDNDEPKMQIQTNSFTNWVLKEQGQDKNIIDNFQRYTNKFLNPKFNDDFSEVSFSITRGDNESISNIKISKGEQSNFIWSVFYSLLERVIDVLDVTEPADRETNQFDSLEFVFIDDPVSSLDENHLIELAVNLVELIKRRKKDEVKFIITTHNPLFYNVLYNELNKKSCYLLRRFEDGTFEMEEKKGDSNCSFSYHLFLKQTLEQAIQKSNIQKYHFTLLRNLYEKTASFLGYQNWPDLLPPDKQLYYQRIINFTSHSSLSNEVVSEPTDAEKKIVSFLLKDLRDRFNFWQEGKSDV